MASKPKIPEQPVEDLAPKDKKKQKKQKAKKTEPEPELVFYDLETTGLKEPHILQLAAVLGEDKFNVYIRPKVPIEPQASLVNKITFQDNVMMKDGKKVEYISIKEALQQFLEFLKPDTILGGQNILKFDNPILYRAMVNNKMADEFADKIKGSIDNIDIFRSLYQFKSNSQKALIGNVLGEEEPVGLHDALVDAEWSRKLYIAAAMTHENISVDFLHDWNETVA